MKTHQRPGAKVKRSERFLDFSKYITGGPKKENNKNNITDTNICTTPKEGNRKKVHTVKHSPMKSKKLIKTRFKDNIGKKKGIG